MIHEPILFGIHDRPLTACNSVDQIIRIQEKVEVWDHSQSDSEWGNVYVLRRTSIYQNGAWLTPAILRVVCILYLPWRAATAHFELN